MARRSAALLDEPRFNCSARTTCRSHGRSARSRGRCRAPGFTTRKPAAHVSTLTNCRSIASILNKFRTMPDLTLMSPLSRKSTHLHQRPRRRTRWPPGSELSRTWLRSPWSVRRSFRRRRDTAPPGSPAPDAAVPLRSASPGGWFR